MKTKSNQSSRHIGVLSVVYASLFLITLVTAYTGNLPTHLLNQIPYYDKIGHVVLYCIASYLGHQFFKGRHLTLNRLSLPLWPSLFGIFTITEEIIQGLSPNRTLDGLDMVCSIVGVVAGYALAEWKHQANQRLES